MNHADMTVFIIDDDPAVRDSLTLMLEQAELNVESFCSAQAFLDYYRPDMRGCSIVDINMQEMDGIGLQETLKSRGIPLPIIFLTGHGDIPLSVKAVKAGASDFLTKPVSREKLLASIHSALEEYQSLLAKRETNRCCQSLLAALTEREREVMWLALDGQTNKQIARHLGISHRTVEIHKARVMQKAEASNLLELARIARNAALLNGQESLSV